MLKLVTQMTDEELRNEWYSLRDDSEHYDYMADVHGDEDGHYALTQSDISFRMLVIRIEEDRRAELKAIEQAAEENAYDKMMEAA